MGERTAYDEFIAGLPKAELHVHHVGSARPETVARLAERHPDAGVPQGIDALRDFYTFSDFAHFIDVYLAVVALLRTPEDLHLLTYEVAEGLAAQQVRYAELTMTPFTSVRAGIAIEAYTEAIEDARRLAERDHGIVLRWIYDIPGEAGLASADATLGYALEHGPSTLIGFGLGGPEVPRPQFAPHFEQARAAGLRSLPHAGESTDAQSVRDALDALGAERIGHGIRAVDDPALVERLVAERIPLEVCPTSNIATRCVERLEDHPIRALRDAGVVVTVNSDDPPMFGTTLNREYAIAADLLDLDEDGLADLARTAVEVSYAPDEVKRRVDDEITAYVAEQPRAGRH
ncbi:adenosine deaminase [Knoellia sp. CPCC 206435]|uniref:adenosine deaminase n=1 Tax=Knoellia terrae TaxID=3404797 RepID=UPI003B42B85D